MISAWRSQQDHDIMIGENLLHYRINARLGAGGMGVVYRARDTTLGRNVAVKILADTLAHNTEHLARFRREATLLAQLNHRGIATLFGLEEADGRLFLVMELVEGQTLAERIAESRIPHTDVQAWFRQIAEALEAAHEKGVAHRDLKPANIKIAPDGKVKLLDFGLAKFFGPSTSPEMEQDSAPVTCEATQAGVILGTPAYMSPEQARGGSTDKRTDIWSFGCCLYEALTGRVAFQGHTIADTIARVLEREPDWAAVRAPAKVVDLVRRCLRKDPTRRIHDIADVRLDLEDAFTSELELTPNTTSRRTLGAAAALLALALAAVVVFVWRTDPADMLVTRSLVAPPRGGAFFLEAEGPAPAVVAPDGTHLAFGAVDENGVRRLWVRRLDELNPRLLPGTEDARYAFWSPDSRSLGFFTFQELKRVDIAGGRARSLTNVVNGKGGTWNGEGIIVFAPAAGPLFQMSAAGGPTSPVTALDDGRDEDSHRHPRFLPDGRRFIYAVRNSGLNLQRHRLMLGSLEGGTGQEITQSESHAEVVGGFLWLVRGGALVALPFDLTRATVTGEAVLVADPVATMGGAALGLFSVSESGVLVYHSNWTPEKTALVWYDRSGKRLGVLGAPGVHISVELAPNGAAAAVVRTDETGNEDVWIYNIKNDSAAARLTVDRGNDIEPIWSPDGARVAFTKGLARTLIHIQPVTGGSQAVLLEPGASIVTGDWTSDGEHIVGFSASERAGDLWLLPLKASSRPKRLQQTPFREWQPDLSSVGDGSPTAPTSLDARKCT